MPSKQDLGFLEGIFKVFDEQPCPFYMSVFPWGKSRIPMNHTDN